MARTLDEIRASRPRVDRAKVLATTEADIRRQMAQDGQDPAARLPVFTKRKPGQRGLGKKPALVPVTIRVTPEMREAFRATGAKWQRTARDALEERFLPARTGGKARA